MAQKTSELLTPSWVEQAEKTRFVDDAAKRIERISIVVFEVGGEEYAIPIAEVKEVVKAPHITPLPQTPKYMLGLCNVRGNVVAAIDAQLRIAALPAPDKNGFLIILKDSEIKAGLFIRQVPNTILVAADQVNRSASVIKSLETSDQYVKGVIKLDEKLIFLIDPKALID